jgi:hypothetical protein
MLELDIISADRDESVGSIDKDFLAGASIDFFDECPKVIYVNCKSICFHKEGVSVVSGDIIWGNLRS